MSTPVLSPEALAELALDASRPRYYYADGSAVAYPNRPQAEIPLFVNNEGPFLLRHAPLRLVPISVRVAYALIRASSTVTWPTYSPRMDWVVKASSDFYHGY